MISKIKHPLLVLFLYVVLMLLALALLNQFTDRTVLQDFVKSFGKLGVLVYGIIAYLFVVFVPGYNTPIHIASGYIFGPQLGWLINFITTTAGLFTIIFLVKRFGPAIVEWLVGSKNKEKYDKLLSKIAPLSLFVMYVLPGFPDDEVTYLMAASQEVRFVRYILPVVLGTIAKTSVSYIGDQGAVGVIHSGIARASSLVVGLVIIGLQEYFYRKNYLKQFTKTKNTV